MREYVRKRIRDIPTARVGILEKIEGDTARCIVNEQVYPVRFVAGLGLTERVGEEVVITFIDKDLSDGIVTGIVTDEDTSAGGVSTEEFGILAGRVGANEGLISDNADNIGLLDGRVGVNESGLASLGARVGTAESNITSLGNTKADKSALTEHTSATNPHGITKATVGLFNVDNTSDLAKPISTATQTELNKKATITALNTGLATKVGLTGDESIAGLKNFTGTYTEGRRFIAWGSNTSTHGIVSRGSQANMLYDNVGVTGGIASALIDVDITNGDDKKARVGKVGIYGSGTSGVDGYPALNYMWFSAITDNTYNRDATLKVDSQDRVGIAIAGTGRPSQALDVNGKIRMRSQTVAGDGADIVTTKGYVDGNLDTKANTTVLTAHTGNTSNPHNVTKAHVGLDKVDNVKQYSATNQPPYPVTSVAGKTGAVTLAEADIPALGAGKITSGAFSTVRIPSLPASKITSGAFSTARIPALPASKITSGALDVDRIPQLGITKVTNLQTALNVKADTSDLDAHVNNKNNPHAVTKAQVGLGNVNNTTDMAKPVSTAQKAALDGKVSITGNEDIDGSKNFLNDVHMGRGGSLNSFLRLYNDSLGATYDEISNGMVGRIGGVIGRIGSQNVTETSYWVGANNTRMEFRLYRPNASDKTVSNSVGIFVDSDGERWASQNMRSSPGSSDAVNVKYVLDRVDELVDYVKLYQHSILLYSTAGCSFSVAFNLINTSPTPINNVVPLRAYLGSSAEDFISCSGVFWAGDSNPKFATGVRGGDMTEFILRGTNIMDGVAHFMTTKDWMLEEVLVEDKVREII